MRKVLLLLSISLLAILPAFAENLLKDSVLVHYSTAQVDSLFTANGLTNPLIPVTHGMSLHRIIYSTRNVQDNDTTIASGLLVVPDSISCPLPIAVYDHGTTTERNDVPSRQSYESVIAILLAELGYYAVLPDYLGLGDSPGRHPYIHAHSEATATIDMIKVCQTLASSLNVELNGQLFLTGYSQGGHACMATHREIQLHHPELTVTGSSPNSGPYNLSGVQARIIASNAPYSDPSYLPYIIFGYQDAYPALAAAYPNDSNIFKHPYDTILRPLFDGRRSTNYIDARMPNTAGALINPIAFNDYLSDSVNNPLRIVLRDNDVYNGWHPTAPIQITYCDSDEQVFAENGRFAYNYFQSNGDTLVTIKNGGPLTHGGCVEPALTNTFLFFNRLRKLENNLTVTLDADSASAAGVPDAGARVHVSGGTGYTINWSTGSTDSVIQGIGNGTYTVIVTDAKGCSKTRSISTGGTYLGINDVDQQLLTLNVFPNPANNVLNYSAQATNNGRTTLEMFDINGSKVYSENVTVFGNQTGSIDISHLSTGIYCLKLSTSEKTVTKRVSISR